MESEVKEFYDKYGVEPDTKSLAQEYGVDEVRFVLKQVLRAEPTNALGYLYKTLSSRLSEGQSISTAKLPKRDITFMDTLTFKELYNRTTPVEVSIMGERQVITEGMLRQLIAKIESGVVSDDDRFLIWLAIYTSFGYNNADICAAREMESMELRHRIHVYYQSKEV